MGMVVEILTKKGITINEDGKKAKAGKMFNARFLYKNHFYYLNRGLIDRVGYQNLHPNVKREIDNRWAYGTVFTEGGMEIIPKVTSSSRKEQQVPTSNVRQPEIMLEGMQARSKEAK